MRLQPSTLWPVQARLGVIALLLTAACEEDAPFRGLGAVFVHAERVDFGRVPIGATRTLDLEVSNRGSAAGRISRVELSEEAIFSASPSSLTIVGGDSDRLQIRFRPLEVDKVQAELTLISDQTQQPVQLLGEGVSNALVATPNPVDFGRVLRGTTSTRAVTLTSFLPEPALLSLEIDKVSGSGDFTLESPASPDLGEISPGETKSLVLAYTPAPLGALGFDRGLAEVQFCPSSGCRLLIDLQGEAIDNPVVCRPDHLDFGAVLPDRRKVLVTRCENTANQPVQVTDVRPSNDSHPSFSVDAIEPLTLAPDEELTLEARLDVEIDSPPERRTGQLNLAVQEVDGPARLGQTEVSLEVIVGGPVLEAPPTYNFGRVQLGQSQTAIIELNNRGTGLLEVETASVSGPFFVEPMQLPIQLIEGERGQLALLFTPREEGVIEGPLVLTSNGLESERVVVQLVGTGVELAPCQASWEPSLLDFGDVLAFRTTTRAAQLRNTGDAPCLVRNAQLLSTETPFGLVQDDNLDAIIEPGRARTFILSYQPGSPRRHENILTVRISNPSDPQAGLPLFGSGQDFTLLLDPDEIDFGLLAQGCETSQLVRIHNPGRSAIFIDQVFLDSAGDGSIPFRLAGPEELLSGEGTFLPAFGSASVRIYFEPNGNQASSVAQLRVRTSPALSVSATVLGTDSLDPIIEERWTQTPSASVDALLVIDNSNSMRAEQEELRRSFPRFIQYAKDQGIDFRIAAVTTDTEGFGQCEANAGNPAGGLPRGSCGFFSEGSETTSNPDWRVVEANELPSPEVAFTEIANVGLGGATLETGLQAAAWAVTPQRLQSWNRGFLTRPNAFFTVVFLTDEDDQSPGDTFYYESLLSSVKGSRFRTDYAMNGIIIDPLVCGGGSGEGALRYVEPIVRSGGTIGSICESNYDDTIDRIARAAAGLRERFPLRRPVFSPSVEVTVADVPLTAQSNGKIRWVLDRAANAVEFEPASVPRVGEEVVIRYRPRCSPPRP